jgi:two-component system cell cycle sensor histidine kinase/response regulator CckA
MFTEQPYREILRQASAALGGRTVTLWEATGTDRLEPRVSTGKPKQQEADVLVELLHGWHMPITPGSRWVCCNGDSRARVVAPVREAPPAPPPGKERRNWERLALELAGLCLGLVSHQRDAEERFRLLVEHSTEAIALLDADGRIRSAGQGIGSLFGRADAEMTGRLVFEMVHPDDVAKARELFGTIRARPGVPVSGSVRCAHKDGSWRSIEAMAVNRLDDPSVGAIVANYRDVTEHRRVEEALRASEALYRVVTESASDGIITIDSTSRIRFVNPAAERLFGWSSAELVGQPLTLLMPDRLASSHEMSFDSYLTTGQRHVAWSGVSLKGRRRDGTEIALEVSLSEYAAEGERLFTGVIRDVTARRRAEHVQTALYHISEAASQAPGLPQLLAAIHRIVGELMPARNFYISLYDAAADLISFPYYVDEMDPPPAPRKPAKGLTEYVLRTGKPLLGKPEVFADLIERGEIKMAGAKCVHWLGVPLVAGGRTIGVLAVQTYAEGEQYGEPELGILRFVSTQIAMTIERKRAEEARRKADAELAVLGAAMRQVAEIALITDREGMIEYVNQTFERVTGFTREEAIGQSPRLLRSGVHEPDVYRKLWETLLAGDVYTGVLVNAKKSGEHFTAEVVITPLRDERGAITHFVELQRDVTVERQLQEQLRQAQKMEEVGRLAGGIAHDFNNLLTAILSYTDFVLFALGADHPAREDAEQVRGAALKAAGLTRQLLAFSRRQVLQPRLLDLNGVVSEMERLLRRLIGEHIVLKTRLAAGLGAVRADPSQIEQVVVNLAVNARDAMPQGGVLTIETALVDEREVRGHGKVTVARGSYVMLRMADTGTGMDAETRRRLFEPFFTTKERGQGTGLGLATIYGIIKQSGGYIWVESEPGAGTTFTVHLPQVESAATAPSGVASTLKESLRGSETVLLVEDDRAVRDLGRRSLADQGYRVLEAVNGAEALRLASSYEGPIHLLLTDVVMPEMGGRALAEALGATRPDMALLFVSGYTEDAVIQHGIQESGLPFLQKPFTPSSLLGMVREVLDERG